MLNSFSAALIDRIMKAIWAAAMWLLRTAFALMDSIGGFRDGSTAGRRRRPAVAGRARSSPSGPP